MKSFTEYFISSFLESVEKSLVKSSEFSYVKYDVRLERTKTWSKNIQHNEMKEVTVNWLLLLTQTECSFS